MAWTENPGKVDFGDFVWPVLQTVFGLIGLSLSNNTAEVRVQSPGPHVAHCHVPQALNVCPSLYMFQCMFTMYTDTWM